MGKQIRAIRLPVIECTFCYLIALKMLLRKHYYTIARLLYSLSRSSGPGRRCSADEHFHLHSRRLNSRLQRSLICINLYIAYLIFNDFDLPRATGAGLLAGRGRANAEKMNEKRFCLSPYMEQIYSYLLLMHFQVSRSRRPFVLLFLPVLSPPKAIYSLHLVLFKFETMEFRAITSIASPLKPA